MPKNLSDYGIPAARSLFAGQIICDGPGPRRAKQDKMLLERHFNDLYAVFLHKLTAFALQSTTSKEEIARLRLFFDELTKAREDLGR